MGDQAKESEKAKPPWVVQSGLWELPRGQTRRLFSAGPAGTSLAVMGCSLQATGPRGVKIKG